MAIVFRVTVARSVRSDRKLWTVRPSWVRLVSAFLSESYRFEEVTKACSEESRGVDCSSKVNPALRIRAPIVEEYFADHGPPHRTNYQQ